MHSNKGASHAAWSSVLNQSAIIIADEVRTYLKYSRVYERPKMDNTKRTTLKGACCCSGLMTKAVGNAEIKTPLPQTSQPTNQPRAKVYFTRHIDAEHLIKLYNLVNHEITSKVAIKLHTSERHGPNILPRELVKAFQAQIPNSTIVETNTLYKGDRYTN